jgi:peptidoglycan/LPS O-acetylase OafA/YrhL
MGDRSNGLDGMRGVSVPARSVNRYESLDGMRGLCAVFVMIFHCDLILQSGHLLNHGWLSVDIFFVLSGFVIALTYENRLRTGMPATGFLKARARRLIPVHILGTLLVGASYLYMLLSGTMPHPVSGPLLAFAFVYGVLLIPITFSPYAGSFRSWDTTFPINTPIWSLNAEWIVNIIYGNHLYEARDRTLLLLFLGWAGYFLWAVFVPLPSWMSTGVAGFMTDTIRGAGGFTAGVLVYRVSRTGGFRKFPVIRAEIIYAIWFLVCSIPSDRPRPGFQVMSTLVVAPLLVALLVRSDREMPKVFRLLGRLSYPLYASHWAVCNLLAAYLAPAPRHSAFWVLPAMAIALPLAWAVDRISQRLTPRVPLLTRELRTAIPDKIV